MTPPSLDPVAPVDGVVVVVGCPQLELGTRSNWNVFCWWASVADEAVEAQDDEITLTDGLMVTNSCSTSMCDT
jgi:hypothetical protein